MGGHDNLKFSSTLYGRPESQDGFFFTRNLKAGAVERATPKCARYPLSGLDLLQNLLETVCQISVM